jgi:hypothetical protein
MATFGTFTTGQVLTAAELNALGTWTAFTPTWVNVTVGNGTQSAFYSVINKILFVRLKLTFGSTTSFGDPVQLTLPNSYVAQSSSQLLLGTSTEEDTGVATYIGTNYLVSTISVRPSVQLVNSTYSVLNFVNATRPFTWGNTDVLSMEFGIQLS